MTIAKASFLQHRGGVLQVFSQTSAANTAQTCRTDGATNYRVYHVDVAYSAVPVQTGVTVTLNSLLGAGFDTLIQTGTANGQYFFWQPTAGDYVVIVGDTLDVVCPAAGGVITSSVSIYAEAI